MLKIENVVLPSPEQWEAVIRGMRNPMNSWDKSDSHTTYIEDAETMETAPYEFFVGEADLALMKKLGAAGTDHRKFMRMIPVFLDITAPLYWWKEFDTYKVGTVANSCSTMHKIHAKRFQIDDFSHEHMSYRSLHLLGDTVDTLNKLRDLFLGFSGFKEEFGEADKKDYWWQMIQLLPTSYNQKRTVMLNYEVLAHIYKSRRNHKLDEWHVVCDWIETLPYSELITGEKKKPESDEVKEKSLSYIYRQLKKAKIALARAEEKQNADEIADLKIKIEALDWLSEIALKENN